MKNKWYAIAAVDQNLGIGMNGELPWPREFSDLKWFQRKTANELFGNVLMGRRTYDSLKSRLWNRQIFVLTKRAERCKFLYSELVFENGKMKDSTVNQIFFESQIPRFCWIAGGRSVYEKFLPQCDKLFLTRIKGSFPSDTFFPEFQDTFEKTRNLFDCDKYSIELWLNRNI